MAKILIVDDKESNLFALERVLRTLDVAVVKAVTGDDALRASLDQELALAILDVQMPTMDGYELASRLRGSARTCHVPIIFLSAAYSDEPCVFKGYESGGVDFITKPFDPRVLLSKVRIFLDLNEQKTELVNQKCRLEALVSRLEEQIEARKWAEDALKEAHDELEWRVEERTSELILANRQLRHEIHERTRVEEALRESESQLKSLSSKLLIAQEDERKRLARELHDSIGGSLSAIKFGIESTLGKISKCPEAVELLERLVSIAQLAIEDSRRIYNDLRPTILDDLGIVSTLGWFCRRFGKVYSDVRIEQQITVEEHEILEPLKIAIFRIVQEAFHNSVKYSKTDRIDLRLVNEDGAILLVIGDRGIGFDLEQVLAVEGSARGLGLTTMKERAYLSGGTFSVESRIGKGTVIRVSWPHQPTRA